MASTTRQLEVQRIYSVRSGRAAPVAVETRARVPFSVLGAMSLIVAATWLYLTWWPADRLISTNLTTTTLARLSAMGDPLGVDRFFGRAPPELANPAPPEDTEPMVLPEEEGPPAETGPSPQQIQAEASRALAWLAGDMCAWLAITTIVGAWLALCGGSAVAGSPITDSARRRPLILVAIVLALVAVWIGVKLWKKEPLFAVGGSHAATIAPGAEIAFVALALLVGWLLAAALPTRWAGAAAVVLTLALVAGGVLTWVKLEAGYPAAAPRIAAVAVMVMATLVGAAAHRRTAVFHRWAVVLILVATVATVIGLQVAESFGGIHTHALTGTTYVCLVAAQASYAAVLAAALALRLR